MSYANYIWEENPSLQSSISEYYNILGKPQKALSDICINLGAKTA